MPNVQKIRQILQFHSAFYGDIGGDVVQVGDDITGFCVGDVVSVVSAVMTNGKNGSTTSVGNGNDDFCARFANPFKYGNSLVGEGYFTTHFISILEQKFIGCQQASVRVYKLLGDWLTAHRLAYAKGMWRRFGGKVERGNGSYENI